MKVIAQIAIAIALLLIGLTVGFKSGSNMKANMRDYQLDVTQDSILVYDGNRLVGTMKLQYDADPLGTMILEDNQ